MRPASSMTAMVLLVPSAIAEMGTLVGIMLSMKPDGSVPLLLGAGSVPPTTVKAPSMRVTRSRMPGGGADVGVDRGKVVHAAETGRITQVLRRERIARADVGGDVGQRGVDIALHRRRPSGAVALSAWRPR